MKIPEDIHFDADGLITTVVQDADSKEVLMVAWMNREALEKTLDTGLAHFWSRSRKKMWQKGESSGHVQQVREIRFDCDGDTLLLLATQKVAACHEGYTSCFFRRLSADGATEVVARRIFDPGSVYGRP
ncbi:MAG: phosphoribosyl-AMP cyclohydrolase [Planctomycetota bacterium]